jgi:uncharacterized membrane protein YagU involved in acid resistance
MKPPIYGYVRALPDLDDQAVSHLHDELAHFAFAAGFTLARVFVERRWLRLAAWDALVDHCKQHEVRNVVVPTSEHLHTLPALSFVMQSVIEDVIGGCVWFVHPDTAEELSCPSRSRSTAP